MKSEREQEVRVQVDVSLTVATKYSAEEVREIVKRGLRGMFPNNWKQFHAAKFAEEHAIYSASRRGVVWTVIPQFSAHARKPKRRAP